MQIIRNLIIFYAFFLLFFVVFSVAVVHIKQITRKKFKFNSRWYIFQGFMEIQFLLHHSVVCQEETFHLLKCLSASSNSIKLSNFSDFTTQNEKCYHKLIANKFFLFVGVRQGLWRELNNFDEKVFLSSLKCF